MSRKTIKQLKEDELLVAILSMFLIVGLSIVAIVKMFDEKIFALMVVAITGINYWILKTFNKHAKK